MARVGNGQGRPERGPGDKNEIDEGGDIPGLGPPA